MEVLHTYTSGGHDGSFQYDASHFEGYGETHG